MEKRYAAIVRRMERCSSKEDLSEIICYLPACKKTVTQKIPEQILREQEVKIEDWVYLNPKKDCEIQRAFPENKNRRFALLADIHSNYMALSTCIEICKKEQVEGFIFLGDYVSDCPYPQKTMKQIYQIQEDYPAWFIRGNREDYQIEHEAGKSPYWKAGSSTGSLLYTYQHLTTQDLEFFKSLPNNMELSFPGFPNVTICHGSPVSTRELMVGGSPLSDRYLLESTTELLIAAHTHKQEEYYQFGKRLVNPGSVGIAHGVSKKAQFALLNGKRGNWKLDYRTIDYPIEEFLEEFQKSPMMEICPIFSKNIMDELQTGETCLINLVSMAERLAKSDGYQTENFRIPEKYWEQAYLAKLIEQRKKIK